MAGVFVRGKISNMSTTPTTQAAPNYKLRMAWSASVFILLGLMLPAFQPVRGFATPPMPGTSQPPDHAWYLASATAAAIVFAVVPWIPRRFSVRGLLILMTLVAVGLSLCVWMARNNSLATH